MICNFYKERIFTAIKQKLTVFTIKQKNDHFYATQQKDYPIVTAACNDFFYEPNYYPQYVAK